MPNDAQSYGSIFVYSFTSLFPIVRSFTETSRILYFNLGSKRHVIVSVLTYFVESVPESIKLELRQARVKLDSSSFSFSFGPLVLIVVAKMMHRGRLL